jgi:hypothetical protein
VPNYLNILNNWSEYFGKENIIVRPLEKQQVPDLYQDFLKTIEIDSMEGFQSSEDRHIKPNLAQLIALSYINKKMAAKIGLTEEGMHRLDLKLDRLFLEKYPLSFLKYTSHWQSPTQYNLMPDRVAKSILEKSEKQNKRIAKQFLNRKDGKLFYEPLVECEGDRLSLDNLDRQQSIDLASYLCEFAKMPI